MTTILITGAAGFIGSHLVDALSEDPGKQIIALDNFNDYYDPLIKRRNLDMALRRSNVTLYETDILDMDACQSIFEKEAPEIIFHLAARAGVRPSIGDPGLYMSVNIEGTLNMMTLAIDNNVKKAIVASSSSVYGNNDHIPFSESDDIHRPVSPYAVSKRAAELLCGTLNHLHGLPIACVRFFTVYGPRQRPDMAIHKFTANISKGLPIPVYNQGKCKRDYTYIDDIIQGLIAIAERNFGFDIINLGEQETTSTLELIGKLEHLLGRTARQERLPEQAGDVLQTYANIDKAKRHYGYAPSTPIDEGLAAFVSWYKRQEEEVHD